MPSITIRRIPDETRDELAARSARRGQSLQEYLRDELIELARKPDVRTLMERIATRKRTMDADLSVDQILAHRDAGRE